jgi:hypothetical protein
MGTEQNHCAISIGRLEFFEPVANRFGHCIDETAMHGPTVDNAPFERVTEPGTAGSAPELIEARAGGATGKLGILGECHGPLDAIGVHRS